MAFEQIGTRPLASPLARHAMPSHAAAMFVVTEADAAAIRAG
jgi:hypothetical protein